MKTDAVIAVSIVLALFVSQSCFAASNTALLCVRQAVSNVVSQLSLAGERGSRQFKEFGFRPNQSSGYQELSQCVSNNFVDVYSSFGFCANNEMERLVLLSAGWAFDDDYFMRCYSNNVLLAEKGDISRDDLKWFCDACGVERRVNLLALRIDEPGVSNLVMRIREITGMTNYYNRVLSGDARVAYTNYLHESSGSFVR